MLKLIGIVLVLTGCGGIAGSICKEGKKRLTLLKHIRSIYEGMKYYIGYQKIPMPEVLMKLAEHNVAILTPAFLDIYKDVIEENMDFAKSWEKTMETALTGTPLKKEDKQLLLDFPNCLGYLEKDAQAGALDELLRETIHRIDETEAEQKSNNKVIMSIGTAVGVLISILLL